MKLLTIRSMPVAPVSVCGASKDGFFHDKWRRRDLKVSQWLHGVTQTARSTSVWTVLIDSGAAAGPWWVIGWVFFSPLRWACWDRPRSWLSNGHIVALINISRRRHSLGGTCTHYSGNLQENLGVYPEDLLVQIKVRRGFICQHPARLFKKKKKLGRTLLAKKSDLICDQERILLPRAALDCKHKWIWQFF